MAHKQLAILVRQAPYTTIGPAEAVRHAGGALADGWDVRLLLVDDGVCLARNGQAAGDTGYVCLSSALAKVMAKGARVMLLDRSAQIHQVVPGQPGVLPGVSVMDDRALAGQLLAAGTVMVY
jgi:sulfur relay (sulfurtransferase) complex TusBCD TusD component (DsrE family)